MKLLANEAQSNELALIMTYTVSAIGIITL